MGSNLGCCDNQAATLSSTVLTERLQGDRRRISERPDVWVTIEQVLLKDSPEATFCPSKFSVKGLAVHVTIEITGTNQQIMKEIGAEAALKLMDKVKVFAATKKASELTGNMGNQPKAVSSTSLIEVKDRKEPGLDRVAASGKGSWDAKETKVFDLHALVSMSRETGHNEVLVEIKQLEAELIAEDGNAKRVSLQSSELRKFIEMACSQRALEVVVQQAQRG